MENFRLVIKYLIWPVVVLVFVFYFAHPVQKILYSLNDALLQGGFSHNDKSSEDNKKDQHVNLGDLFNSGPYFRKALAHNLVEGIGEPLENPQIPAHDLAKVHEKSLLSVFESSLQNFIKKQPEGTSKESILEDLLYDAYVCLYFERTFQNILGSQVTLLETLFQNKKAFMSEEEANDLFKRSPAALLDLSYERWITFLSESGLIHRTNTGMNLTRLGREFLKYIQERDYNPKKPG